jgi:limonene-1,2-epoxide hydrolase
MTMSDDQAEAKRFLHRFFERWGESYDEMCASLRDGFAPDGIWLAGPVSGPTAVPESTGAAGAIAQFDAFRAAYDMTTIDVDIVRLGVDAGAVFVERIDHLIDSSGRRIVSVPVVGVITLDEEQRIKYWREYWDMHELLQLGGGA